MNLPLANLRVLDLSRILAGPWATQLLADLGAEIIKVERPGVGDDSRIFGPVFIKDEAGKPTDESAFYLCTNRNKKSITVDIGSPQGQDIIRRLAAKCDVVVENFKVGTLGRYGLDAESLKAIYPGLVYCSLTGFGQSGPYAERAGYDPIFQAMSGLMSVTGDSDGPPMKVGPSIVDIITGLYACVAILSAVYRRDAGSGKGAKGASIDLALLDCAIASMSHMAMSYLVSGEIPERRGTMGNGGTPSTTLRCADGHAYIVVGNDSQFARFCEAIGRSDLAAVEQYRKNADRLANRAELLPIIEAEAARMTVAEFTGALNSHGVPAAPIYDMKQVFDDPQVRQRDMKISVDHNEKGEQLWLVGNPIKMSNASSEHFRAPPRLGQHTEEIMVDLLGMDKATIARLQADEVI
jgi:crotonobetainyl-CoA:carnitine CoA-transferase CaiB-like acyl-CoA transferase